MSKLIEDRYLGDGVYASCDGYYILLDLRGQDNTTRIALEPGVFAALGRFKADLDMKIHAAMKGGGE
jgi:hypothetical protein